MKIVVLILTMAFPFANAFAQTVELSRTTNPTSVQATLSDVFRILNSFGYTADAVVTMPLDEGYGIQDGFLSLSCSRDRTSSGGRGAGMMPLTAYACTWDGSLPRNYWDTKLNSVSAMLFNALTVKWEENKKSLFQKGGLISSEVTKNATVLTIQDNYVKLECKAKFRSMAPRGQYRCDLTEKVFNLE